MRAVVQRISETSVEVDSSVCGAIDAGLLVYLGVGSDDANEDVTYLADKVRHLRIFPDDSYHMNLDVAQASGKVLVISAFTVQADARRGRRPAFEAAAPADRALVMYELFCDTLSQSGVEVQRGSFGAKMNVESVNAGPICILLDSRRTF